MNRATAVEMWREVCGSDTVMAMMPPTGRMLEEFARRIEAVERLDCAKVAYEVANDNEFDERTGTAIKCRIMARSNVKVSGVPLHGTNKE